MEGSWVSKSSVYMGEECARQVQRPRGIREPGMFEKQPGGQYAWGGVGMEKTGRGWGQRGERRENHAVAKAGFPPPTPSCKWKRRKKNKPCPGTEIFAERAMDNQELPVQFPKWSTFKVEDLQPKWERVTVLYYGAQNVQFSLVQQVFFTVNCSHMWSTAGKHF